MSRTQFLEASDNRTLFTMKGVLFLFICAIYFKACSFCDVKTNRGVVNGIQQLSKNGKFYWSFNGIPYAEPPIGKLRFKAPVPKIPWIQTLKAHEVRDQCIEFRDGVKGQEDCLYLNIHTPQLGTDVLLPVMVYIHGGSSTQGNASKILDGPGYLLDKNVVVVTINFRLSIMGFLSTGDLAAPGNFGLKDQVQALYWIKNNIRQFGGNPDDITLFGEGFGADCVHLHTLSKRSTKLFKRGILQSGAALNPRAFTSDPSYYQIPKKVAAKLNCPTANSLLMIECLRKANAQKLVDTLSVFDELSIESQTLWRPTKEPSNIEAFLTNTPENLIRENNFNDCPLITGNVVDEGTFFTRRLVENQKLYDECVKNPVSVIERFLRYYEPLRGKNVTNLAAKIVKFYFGNKVSGDKDSIISIFTKFATDFFYIFPQIQLVESMKTLKKTPFYSYQFNYHGALSYALLFGGEFAKHGIAQGDDLFYLFPLSSKSIGAKFNIERTKDDFKVIDLLIDLWTSFAKNSKPSSTLMENAHTWESYKIGGYLKIGNGTDTKAKLTKVDLTDSLKFWLENVPQYSLTSSCKHSKEDNDSKEKKHSKEDSDSKEDSHSKEDKKNKNSKEDSHNKQ
ncbi:esterase E4-like isoform X2 [Colletes gigas]|uniref:esterase E4-like isoform X2 n=1 Tax=Colletes gigas TaxID=935657 RepID=UPI001C9A46D3|nr:esterase E4-like isoform X2 [Colletes gigas]